LEYYKEDKELSPMKLDILSKFVSGMLPLPSEKQATIIYDIYMEADDIGWSPPD